MNDEDFGVFARKSTGKLHRCLLWLVRAQDVAMLNQPDNLFASLLLSCKRVRIRILFRVKVAGIRLRDANPVAAFARFESDAFILPMIMFNSLRNCTLHYGFYSVNAISMYPRIVSIYLRLRNRVHLEANTLAELP